MNTSNINYAISQLKYSLNVAVNLKLKICILKIYTFYLSSDACNRKPEYGFSILVYLIPVMRNWFPSENK